MKKSGTFGIVILAFVAGLLGSCVWSSFGSKPSITTAAKESTYDRVMRTGTIRCGYAMWPPFIMKDPNSGKLSGFEYDYMQALGDALHLKIDWSEEVGWGDFPSALNAGRIDAFCAGAWPSATRAREIDFTRPIVYQPLYAYVRAGDPRFDNNSAAIDDPSVTAVTMDGEMSSLVAASDFLKAKTVQLPQLSNASELLLNVVTGKGDVTFTDSITESRFAANNPGKIRRVVTKMPLRVFGVPLAIARGQDAFAHMVNIATDEMLLSGKIEKILAPYDQPPGTFLHVAPPYTVPSGQ
jgi:polar amino acid transport system substrate-binding protein